MKQADIRYEVYVQPMRGRAKRTDTTVRLPLPGKIEWLGGTYHFAYLDTIKGYIVYAEAKPTPA